MSKGEVNNKYKLHKIINIKNIISIQSCFIYFAFLGGTLLPVSHKIKYKQSVSQFVFVVFFLNGVYQNNKTSQGCTRYMQQYCTSFRNILVYGFVFRRMVFTSYLRKCLVRSKSPSSQASDVCFTLCRLTKLRSKMLKMFQHTSMM